MPPRGNFDDEIKRILLVPDTKYNKLKSLERDMDPQLMMDLLTRVYPPDEHAAEKEDRLPMLPDAGMYNRMQAAPVDRQKELALKHALGLPSDDYALDPEDSRADPLYERGT